MLSAVREVVARPIASKEELETDWKTGLFSIAVDGEKPWVGEES
jgi:hypothetical protein